MYCPRCGNTQNDDSKFCKSCGANLQAVRQVIDTREGGEKFDWSKTWVAEMFMSEQEQKRRKEELERQRGITPEIKRYHEIKAGVITASVGLGLAIFLYALMQGIISGGKVPIDTAEILARIWVSGVIPMLVGVALIINGVFVSRRIVDSARREEEARFKALENDAPHRTLRPANTAESIPPAFSVTEQSTQHLEGSRRKQ
jgi:hypothetical protein